MPVIEFLDQPGGDDLAPAEELAAGPPPSRNGAAPWLGALALVVLVLFALAQTQTKDKPATDPSPQRHAPAAASTGDQVLFLDGQYFVTRGHALVSVRSANGDNPEVGVDPDASRYALAGDPGQHVVWVAGGQSVQAFDTRSFAPRTGRLVLPAPATGAVVLDGAVYVATASSVVRATVRTGPVVLAVAPEPHLAADPTRHRVLMLAGSQVSVPGVTARATLPVRGSALAVVSGTVWVVAAHELVRLDPATLRPVRGLALPSGAELAATGRTSLLIRNGPALRCVATTSGTVVQAWPTVPRPVGFGADGTIYALPADALPTALSFGTCPG